MFHIVLHGIRLAFSSSENTIQLSVLRQTFKHFIYISTVDFFATICAGKVLSFLDSPKNRGSDFTHEKGGVTKIGRRIVLKREGIFISICVF